MPKNQRVEKQGEYEHPGASCCDRRDEGKSHSMNCRRNQQRHKPQQFPEREIDYTRRLIDDDEGERDKGIECTGHRALDEQRKKERHSLQSPCPPAQAVRQLRSYSNPVLAL